MSIVTDEMVRDAWITFDGSFFEDRLSVASMNRMRRTLERTETALEHARKNCTSGTDVQREKLLSHLNAMMALATTSETYVLKAAIDYIRAVARNSETEVRAALEVFEPMPVNDEKSKGDA